MAAITLRISNKCGGHYEMSLNTGWQIYSYQWQEVPIPDAAIDCVEEMATAEKATEMIDSYPKFEWSPVNPITDGGSFLTTSVAPCCYYGVYRGVFGC